MLNKLRKRMLWSLCGGLLCVETTVAQTVPITLGDVVRLAQEQSIAAKSVRTARETSYWDYKIFQSGNRPQLVLDGVLPNYTNSIIGVTQFDGSVTYQPVRNNLSSLSLGLSQRVNATGGVVTVGTSLQRFDDFNSGRKLYNSNPFFVSLSQPIVGFNALRWDRRIEPLRYRESKQIFIEQMERVGQTASDLFFVQLIEQVNIQIAETNLKNNEVLYAIARVKSDLGRISLNDLLQLQLEVIKSKKAMAEARQNLQAASLRLRTYLGNSLPNPLQLNLPDKIPAFQVDPEKAYEQAAQNRADIIAFERRRLEAERTVARVQGETGPNVTLTGSFGTSNSAQNVAGILINPQSQRAVRLEFRVPVLTWGRARARNESAYASRRLTEFTNEQDLQTFRQQITTQADRVTLLREQVLLSASVDSIADRRYMIAKERFMIGNLSVTDLTLALQEKDISKRNYVLALSDFWRSYWQIRLLTLYDFERNQKIQYEP